MRIWVIAALLFGLAALGLAMGPRAIDWNTYRPDIEAAAARLSGHDVSIRGPIELSILPGLVLTAKDVIVESDDEARIGFTLSTNQADVSLALGPLLAGRPVVRDLRLKRPVIRIDAASSRKMRAWPPRWQDWALPFLNLDIESIGMTDGRIELTGDRPGEELGLHGLSLDLQIGGARGPIEAAGLFMTDHHRFTVRAAFGSPDHNGVSSAKVTIDAQNGIEETTSLRFNGRVRPFGDEEDLRGRLTVSGPDLQLGLSALAAATGYPSTFQSIAAQQPFAIEGELMADRRGLRAEGLQIRLADKLGKGSADLQFHPKMQFDLSVELPILRLADDAGLSDFLPLDLLSRLQVPPGDIDIRVRELVYLDDRARQAGIRLTTGQDRVTRIEQAKIQLPGLVDLRFEGGVYSADFGPVLKGKLAAVGDDLKPSLTWLGLLGEGDSTSGWRGFSLESDVDITSVEIAFSALDVRLDSARISGEAGLRFSERRRIMVDINIDRSNLDLYGMVTDGRIALTALEDHLKAVDAEISLTFEKVTWQGIRVEEGMIQARAEAGRLILPEIRVSTVGDTMLSLKGSVDLETRAADIATVWQSEHPGRALHHLKIDLPLTSRRLRPLEIKGQAIGTLDDADLSLEALYDGGILAIEGKASFVEEGSRYDLSLSATHPDHLALAGQFGLAPLVPEGDADGPLELTGRLRHDEGSTWIASGNAKLGPTTFTGSLAYPEAPFTGPFDAKLSVGSPRKDSLAPLLTLAGLRLTGDWTPGRWLGRLPTTGLRTAWLETMEGSLSLASKGGIVGDGLSLEAELNDGLLRLDQIEASPWQGELRAKIELERRNERPFVTIAIELDQIDSTAFGDWIGLKSGIEGPLDLQLDASSSGLTPYDLMAGLAGDLAIEAGPGALRGRGIPLFRETLAAGTGDRIAADSRLTMPFRAIDAEAKLSRGALIFEDGSLVLNAGDDKEIEATVDGTVDMLLWVLDLTMTTTDSSDPTPASYRLVGPPDQPAGRMLAGN